MKNEFRVTTESKKESDYWKYETSANTKTTTPFTAAFAGEILGLSSI